jgi:hypothetical protein
MLSLVTRALWKLILLVDCILRATIGALDRDLHEPLLGTYLNPCTGLILTRLFLISRMMLSRKTSKSLSRQSIRR